MLKNHTPGPWTIHHEYNVIKDNRSIANCGGHTVNTPNWPEVEEENKANARLIAAAPALLAVLTEGVGIPVYEDFASDLETIANQLEWKGLPVYAEKIRAKAQAIRDAVSEARGE